MRKEDKNTRYYIDLDLEKNKIIQISYGQKENLEQELSNTFHQRVFVTKGQYNKVMNKFKKC